MRQSRNTGVVGSASFVVHPGLQRVAAGYVDEEIVTVRKMAAAGATLVEIGNAIGKSSTAAGNIIRRNNIARVQASTDRHVLKSAQTIGSYMERGAYDWHEEALSLRRAGASQREIADALNVDTGMVSKLMRKHGLGRISLANDKRTERHAEKREIKALGTLPKLPNTGTYLAKNNTGQWFYINHAGTWQTCPPPFPSGEVNTAHKNSGEV